MKDDAQQMRQKGTNMASPFSESMPRSIVNNERRDDYGYGDWYGRLMRRWDDAERSIDANPELQAIAGDDAKLDTAADKMLDKAVCIFCHGIGCVECKEAPTERAFNDAVESACETDV